MTNDQSIGTGMQENGRGL